MVDCSAMKNGFETMFDDGRWIPMGGWAGDGWMGWWMVRWSKVGWWTGRRDDVRCQSFERCWIACWRALVVDKRRMNRHSLWVVHRWRWRSRLLRRRASLRSSWWRWITMPPAYRLGVVVFRRCCARIFRWEFITVYSFSEWRLHYAFITFYGTLISERSRILVSCFYSRSSCRYNVSMFRVLFLLVVESPAVVGRRSTFQGLDPVSTTYRTSAYYVILLSISFTRKGN